MAKTNQRRALGRGLIALIPQDNDESGSGSEVVMVDIHAIRPNPFQPRTEFDEAEIAGLAESIRNHGLQQPVVLRKKVDGYEIISGERRVRALKHLGRDQAPCLVKAKVTDREMLELALIENIQRKDLNDIETAAAYQRLLVECQLSHEELADRVGKSRSAVTNFLRLLKLPDEIQALLKENKISMGHARALLALPDAAQQSAMAQQIAAQDLSVRTLEGMLKQESKKKTNKKPAAAPEPMEANTRQVIEQLQYRLGTQVSLTRKAGTKGAIEIHFYSEDDLARILSALVK